MWRPPSCSCTTARAWRASSRWELQLLARARPWLSHEPLFS
jgi:hypothetical protein